MIDLDALLRLRGGRAGVLLGEMTGKLGTRYVISVRLELDDADTGTLCVAHKAFQHVTRLVPWAAYRFDLVSVPCGFGGRRWAIDCPETGRMVRKLYLPNGAERFASRPALGLAYRSTRKSPLDRRHARLGRAFAALDAPYRGTMQEIPDRPAGMRLRTYARLLGELGAARSAIFALAGNGTSATRSIRP